MGRGMCAAAVLALLLGLCARDGAAQGAAAPDFSFTTREGEHISLEGLAGKTVLLDFWGSWCQPCVASTPALVKLRLKFVGTPVVFVGIAQDGEAAWSHYLETLDMDWPQYLDTGRLVRLFNIDTYPTFIVIDANGIVRARRSGYGSGTPGWIEREIKKTLKD